MIVQMKKLTFLLIYFILFDQKDSYYPLVSKNPYRFFLAFHFN